MKDAMAATRRSASCRDDSSRSFLRLEACGEPNHFGLPITPDLCVGPAERPFLFGGVGLGAAMLAMERVTKRPMVCASAQFVSFARPGERLSLDVRILAAGRRNSQALVTGAVGDRSVLSVAGALGTRTQDCVRQWTESPPMPAPDACPAARHRHGDVGAHARLEVRVAKGRYGPGRIGAPEADGRLVLWARPRDDAAIDAAFLAILADLAPDGIGNALGENAGGNSLDNVLRIIEVRPTRWVMVDIGIQAIGAGIAHAVVTLSTDRGSIMALGSQSIIVRAH